MISSNIIKHFLKLLEMFFFPQKYKNVVKIQKGSTVEAA
jgi:hypothetical protein